MLNIENVNHIGIRIKEKTRSVAFYGVLGFEFNHDAGFEQGHPIIMRHPSGVVLNLLDPSNTSNERNILMDVDEKYPGITHVSFKVASMDAAKRFLRERSISLTGEFTFKGMHAVFIRDPDRNVIELDAYEGDEPATRSGDASDFDGYDEHP